ncbi:hypothetical protein SI65_02186 [Aspergillus cristatus]|uniref:Uncharacterized protein n=1 Tax=Aspergillus cristatus TaxID=573508 RepID=A0A1E3BK30_ASPCR|nr:hypothetical protein SI65_02186 [Aspergillus cristatus]
MKVISDYSRNKSHNRINKKCQRFEEHPESTPLHVGDTYFKRMNTISQCIKYTSSWGESGDLSNYMKLYAHGRTLEVEVNAVLKDDRSRREPHWLKEYLTKVTSFPVSVHALLRLVTAPALRSRFLLGKSFEVEDVWNATCRFKVPPFQKWEKVAEKALETRNAKRDLCDSKPGLGELPGKTKEASINCEIAIVLTLLSKENEG